ncbi:MAG: hypothetical protein ACE366_05385 [Bradymonadia bacterium]
MSVQSAPHQGLFAFYNGEFHHHFQDEPELDHVMWFERIGLPSSGPGFDTILRGKVTEDLDTEEFIIGFYGTATLSNARYNKIVEVFGLGDSRIVEKMLMEPY